MVEQDLVELAPLDLVGVGGPRLALAEEELVAEIHLLVVVFLQIDDAVRAERADRHAGARVERNQAVARRHVQDPIVVPADHLLRYLGLDGAKFVRYGAQDDTVGEYGATGGNGFATVEIFRFPDFVKAFGAYASGEYQFAQRWFAGVRLDRSERAADSSLVDKGASALLTFWPSEFSQIRGQYRYTRYGQGITANEFLFQVQFSIGAHGAHTF